MKPYTILLFVEIIVVKYWIIINIVLLLKPFKKYTLKLVVYVHTIYVDLMLNLQKDMSSSFCNNHRVISSHCQYRKKP